MVFFNLCNLLSQSRYNCHFLMFVCFNLIMSTDPRSTGNIDKISRLDIITGVRTSDPLLVCVCVFTMVIVISFIHTHKNIYFLFCQKNKRLTSYKYDDIYWKKANEYVVLIF